MYILQLVDIYSQDWILLLGRLVLIRHIKHFAYFAYQRGTEFSKTCLYNTWTLPRVIHVQDMCNMCKMQSANIQSTRPTSSYRIITWNKCKEKGILLSSNLIPFFWGGGQKHLSLTYRSNYYRKETETEKDDAHRWVDWWRSPNCLEIVLQERLADNLDFEID